mmetsp:Transcript_29557/g.87430  ORF Transcript_29557/g.87430 Transcript_29557/m.87430 type:complete len:121 (+) Transcript_29557:525-887(+)
MQPRLQYVHSEENIGAWRVASSPSSVHEPLTPSSHAVGQVLSGKHEPFKLELEFSSLPALCLELFQDAGKLCYVYRIGEENVESGAVDGIDGFWVDVHKSAVKLRKSCRHRSDMAENMAL